MRCGRVFRWLALATLLSATLALAQTSADLFDDSIVHEIRLVMKPADWTNFKASYLTDNYFSALSKHPARNERSSSRCRRFAIPRSSSGKCRMVNRYSATNHSG